MKKSVGAFVRFSVEAHQDDRVAVELFARGLCQARGRVYGDQIESMSIDEKHYRLVIIPRWRDAGAKPQHAPREWKTFKLADGEMPW